MTQRRYAASISGEGVTRDCLDPWFFAMLKSTRELMPCCWHPAVGTLRIGTSLGELLDGPAIRELRRQLLTGDLNDHCRSCPARSLSSTDALRTRLIDEFERHRQANAPEGEQQPADAFEVKQQEGTTLNSPIPIQKRIIGSISRALRRV